MAGLRVHSVRLATPRLALRPMTEADWPVLLRWNQEPRVLEHWDTGGSEPWTLEKLRNAYRAISRRAFMFVIERSGVPIGEAWIQEMNLPAPLAALPGRRLRRIDLSLGEPELWGRGLGPEVIRALVRFGFEEERADAIFGCDVDTTNRRSERAFSKCGFVPWAEGNEPTGGLVPPARRHWVLERERWRSAASADRADRGSSGPMRF